MEHSSIHLDLEKESKGKKRKARDQKEKVGSVASTI